MAEQEVKIKVVLDTSAFDQALTEADARLEAFLERVNATAAAVHRALNGIAEECSS